MLGYDFLIDSNGKPWLLEINFTPSTATESPKSHRVKSTLLRDLFHLVNLGEKYVKTFDEREHELVAAKNRGEEPYKVYVSQNFPASVQPLLFSEKLCPESFEPREDLGEDKADERARTVRQQFSARLSSVHSCVRCITLEDVENIRQLEIEKYRK